MIASAVFMMAMTVGAPPASAHGTSMQAPTGGGHGGVTDSHYYVYACDTNPDGVGIYTRYEFWYQGTWRRGSVRDANGSAPGCTQVRSEGGAIRSYSVCKDLFGCTGWRTT